MSAVPTYPNDPWPTSEALTLIHGCVRDEDGDRIFPNRSDLGGDRDQWGAPNGRLLECARRAAINSAKYYGVEVGNECWFGNDPVRLVNNDTKLGDNRGRSWDLFDGGSGSKCLKRWDNGTKSGWEGDR